MSETSCPTPGPVTRRLFLSIASATALTSGALGSPASAVTAAIEAPAPSATPSQAAPTAGPSPAFAVDLLGLDAAARADLETLSQPILRETRWLDELPLDDIRPAFAFDPMEGWTK